MRVTSLFSALVAALALAGCSDKPVVEPTPPLTPLTVEEWKALPRETKYEVDSFERLKLGNPSLMIGDGWEKFQRTVVNPARKKDFPNGKSR